MNLAYGGPRSTVIRGIVNARCLDALTPVAEETITRIEHAQRVGDRDLIVDGHLIGAELEIGVLWPPCARRFAHRGDILRRVRSRSTRLILWGRR